tara:strand:- start:12967 stop:13173 length:207 start_codon:yes stop_codon:yes gene_type:complete
MNHYGGMHFIWWIVWFLFLAWIFFIPTDIPYKKTKKGSPLDVLKDQFAKGEISKEEFVASRNILNSEN